MLGEGGSFKVLGGRYRESLIYFSYFLFVKIHSPLFGFINQFQFLHFSLSFTPSPSPSLPISLSSSAELKF